MVGLDSLDEIPPEPDEHGETFEQIARDKARVYAEATGLSCLAEDSGLQVDALGGAPGVLSARYSGSSGKRAERDRANNEKLLAELDGVPPERRSARFVCAMCLVDPDGQIVAETRGTYEGVIAEAPRGDNGFGYDPLLYLPDVRTYQRRALAGREERALAPRRGRARDGRQAARALDGQPLQVQLDPSTRRVASSTRPRAFVQRGSSLPTISQMRSAERRMDASARHTRSQVDPADSPWAADCGGAASVSSFSLGASAAGAAAGGADGCAGSPPTSAPPPTAGRCSSRSSVLPLCGWLGPSRAWMIASCLDRRCSSTSRFDVGGSPAGCIFAAPQPATTKSSASTAGARLRPIILCTDNAEACPELTPVRFVPRKMPFRAGAPRLI